MSGIAFGFAAAAIFAAIAVVTAALPDAQALFLPLTGGGNEYTTAAVSILASLPMLAVMTILALSGRE
jgi:hypothetical protein